MLGPETWRCAELCWQSAGDVPGLGSQPWPHNIPSCDAGRDSYGQISASASWLAKCFLNSEKSPFPAMLSFCKLKQASESHSEEFGLLKGLEGAGDSGPSPASACSMVGESAVDSSVHPFG